MYKLIEVIEGNFVYALKKTDAAYLEPAHWICPVCRIEQRNSILQKGDDTLWECLWKDCLFKLRTSETPEYVEV